MKNVPPPRVKKVVADPPNFDLKFEPCKNFKGKYLGTNDGFAYQHGPDGIGYYPNVPPSSAPPTVVISLSQFINSISMLPFMCPPHRGCGVPSGRPDVPQS